jgi:hypothetical protein
MAARGAMCAVAGVEPAIDRPAAGDVPYHSADKQLVAADEAIAQAPLLLCLLSAACGTKRTSPDKAAM